MTVRRKGRPRDRGEHGSASLWVLAVAGVLAFLATTGVLVGQAVVARHRADAAADLSALAAAADALAGEPTACARAAQLAARSGARLARCSLVNGVSDVLAEVPLHGVFARLGPARSRARAGPPG